SSSLLFPLPSSPTSSLTSLSLPAALPICVDVAVRGLQRLLAFHHAGAGTLSELLDQSSTNRHVYSSCLSVASVVSVSAGVSATSDRKSTRLNSSHVSISYAVFCLKKKK